MGILHASPLECLADTLQGYLASQHKAKCGFEPTTKPTHGRAEGFVGIDLVVLGDTREDNLAVGSLHIVHILVQLLHIALGNLAIGATNIDKTRVVGADNVPARYANPRLIDLHALTAFEFADSLAKCRSDMLDVGNLATSETLHRFAHGVNNDNLATVGEFAKCDNRLTAAQIY